MNPLNSCSSPAPRPAALLRAAPGIRRCLGLGLRALALVLGASAAAAAEPWVAPPEAAATPNAVPSSADSIRRGRTIYEDRCVDCHGRKGRGDGSGGVDLEVRPTDFTQAAVASQSDGALFWKLTQGRRPMPAYSRKLSEAERWNVINYIRSIAPKPKQRRASR